MTKKTTTDIGAQCSKCGADDEWLIIHEDQRNLGGGNFETHYELQCSGEIHYEADINEADGFVVKCNNRKDITLDTSPEFDKEAYLEARGEL